MTSNSPNNYPPHSTQPQSITQSTTPSGTSSTTFPSTLPLSKQSTSSSHSPQFTSLPNTNQSHNDDDEHNNGPSPHQNHSLYASPTHSNFTTPDVEFNQHYFLTTTLQQPISSLLSYSRDDHSPQSQSPRLSPQFSTSSMSQSESYLPHLLSSSSIQPNQSLTSLSIPCDISTGPINLLPLIKKSNEIINQNPLTTSSRSTQIHPSTSPNIDNNTNTLVTIQNTNHLQYNDPNYPNDMGLPMQSRLPSPPSHQVYTLSSYNHNNNNINTIHHSTHNIMRNDNENNDHSQSPLNVSSPCSSSSCTTSPSNTSNTSNVSNLSNNSLSTSTTQCISPIIHLNVLSPTQSLSLPLLSQSISQSLLTSQSPSQLNQTQIQTQTHAQHLPASLSLQTQSFQLHPSSPVYPPSSPSSLITSLPQHTKHTQLLTNFNDLNNLQPKDTNIPKFPSQSTIHTPISTLVQFSPTPSINLLNPLHSLSHNNPLILRNSPNLHHQTYPIQTLTPSQSQSPHSPPLETKTNLILTPSLTSLSSLSSSSLNSNSNVNVHANANASSHFTSNPTSNLSSFSSQPFLPINFSPPSLPLSLFTTSSLHNLALSPPSAPFSGTHFTQFPSSGSLLSFPPNNVPIAPLPLPPSSANASTFRQMTPFTLLPLVSSISTPFAQSSTSTTSTITHKSQQSPQSRQLQQPQQSQQPQQPQQSYPIQITPTLTQQSQLTTSQNFQSFNTHLSSQPTQTQAQAQIVSQLHASNSAYLPYFHSFSLQQAQKQLQYDPSLFPLSSTTMSTSTAISPAILATLAFNSSSSTTSNSFPTIQAPSTSTALSSIPTSYVPPSTIHSSIPQAVKRPRPQEFEFDISPSSPIVSNQFNLNANPNSAPVCSQHDTHPHSSSIPIINHLDSQHDQHDNDLLTICPLSRKKTCLRIKSTLLHITSTFQTPQPPQTSLPSSPLSPSSQPLLLLPSELHSLPTLAISCSTSSDPFELTGTQHHQLDQNDINNDNYILTRLHHLDTFSNSHVGSDSSSFVNQSIQQSTSPLHTLHPSPLYTPPLSPMQSTLSPPHLSNPSSPLISHSSFQQLTPTLSSTSSYIFSDVATSPYQSLQDEHTNQNEDDEDSGHNELNGQKGPSEQKITSDQKRSQKRIMINLSLNKTRLYPKPTSIDTNPNNYQHIIDDRTLIRRKKSTKHHNSHSNHNSINNINKGTNNNSNRHNNHDNVHNERNERNEQDYGKDKHSSNKGKNEHIALSPPHTEHTEQNLLIHHQQPISLFDDRKNNNLNHLNEYNADFDENVQNDQNDQIDHQHGSDSDGEFTMHNDNNSNTVSQLVHQRNMNQSVPNDEQHHKKHDKNENNKKRNKFIKSTPYIEYHYYDPDIIDDNTKFNRLVFKYPNDIVIVYPHHTSVVKASTSIHESHQLFDVIDPKTYDGDDLETLHEIINELILSPNHDNNTDDDHEHDHDHDNDNQNMGLGLSPCSNQNDSHSDNHTSHLAHHGHHSHHMQHYRPPTPMSSYSYTSQQNKNMTGIGHKGQYPVKNKQNGKNKKNKKNISFEPIVDYTGMDEPIGDVDYLNSNQYYQYNVVFHGCDNPIACPNSDDSAVYGITEDDSDDTDRLHNDHTSKQSYSRRLYSWSYYDDTSDGEYDENDDDNVYDEDTDQDQDDDDNYTNTNQRNNRNKRFQKKQNQPKYELIEHDADDADGFWEVDALGRVHPYQSLDLIHPTIHVTNAGEIQERQEHEQNHSLSQQNLHDHTSNRSYTDHNDCITNTQGMNDVLLSSDQQQHQPDSSSIDKKDTDDFNGYKIDETINTDPLNDPLDPNHINLTNFSSTETTATVSTDFPTQMNHINSSFNFFQGSVPFFDPTHHFQSSPSHQPHLSYYNPQLLLQSIPPIIPQPISLVKNDDETHYLPISRPITSSSLSSFTLTPKSSQQSTYIDDDGDDDITITPPRQLRYYEYQQQLQMHPIATQNNPYKWEGQPQFNNIDALLHDEDGVLLDEDDILASNSRAFYNRTLTINVDYQGTVQIIPTQTSSLSSVTLDDSLYFEKEEDEDDDVECNGNNDDTDSLYQTQINISHYHPTIQQYHQFHLQQQQLQQRQLQQHQKEEEIDDHDIDTDAQDLPTEDEIEFHHQTMSHFHSNACIPFRSQYRHQQQSHHLAPDYEHYDDLF